jgi:hypothetical protein
LFSYFSCPANNESQLYEKVLIHSLQTQPLATFLHTSLSHLQIVVAIIARYAVMENLYQQSGGALSLKLEYRLVLISLCSTMLEYFATAIDYANIEVKEQECAGDSQAGAEISEEKLEQIAFRKQNGRERGMQSCAFLVEKIRQKDAACGGFRVVVETTEQSSSDESEGEIELEDVSDEDWERIEGDDIETIPISVLS